MDYIALAGISAGLSMDAFAVSVANGACAKKVTPGFAARLAVCFGLFQGIMPMAGWLVGKAGESLISAVDHWIALLLLGYLGIQMILESRNKAKPASCEQRTDTIGAKTLLALAVATSIDALATGILLPSAVHASTPALMLLSVSVIALVTFVFCFSGVYLGKRFGLLLSGKAELAGGLVLVCIGVKIFVDHMFFSPIQPNI